MARVWGKVIGTCLGFAFGGGPVGAMVGLFVGHAYDARGDMIGSSEGDQYRPPSFIFSTSTQQTTFTTGVVTLAAKLSKIDGKVSREEIDAFKRVFQITPAQEAKVGKMFDSARQSPEGFEPYAFQLAQVFGTSPTILEQILCNLFIIAAADANPISPAEARYLKQVGYIFRFAPEDFKRIAARSGARMPDNDNIREHERNSSNSPFAILGISETATNEEIKVTYRTLIRTHHPDKLVAEGKPPDIVKVATEKLQRINAAYDQICKTRGIK